MGEGEMVPVELLDLERDLKRRTDACKDQINALNTSLDILSAELGGVRRSIEIVRSVFTAIAEAAPEEVEFLPTSKAGGGSGRRKSAGKAASANGLAVSGNPEAKAPVARGPRRDVLSLVRDELARCNKLAPGEWVGVKALVKALSLQRIQVDKTLEKLVELIDWDREMDQVRLHYEEASASAPSEEDRAEVGELPPVANYLIAYPEGVSLDDLLAAGYSRAHIGTAVDMGQVWSDARGYYRRVVLRYSGEQAAE